MFKHLILSLFCLFFIGCVNSHKKILLPNESEFREGDIVFRLGKGLDSGIVQYADGGLYSHVGIVVDYLGMKMIVHSVPQEQDEKGNMDRIKMDSIQCFFSKEKALAGAICRPIDKSICKRSALYAINLYNKKIPFDHDYDYSDTSKLYCTELVMFIYNKCGKKLVETDGHNINFPLIKHKVFLPSDVFKSKQLKLIKQF